MFDLHKSQIVHWDLKTSNILINNKGSVKITDLGLSTFFSQTDLKPSSTLLYRSPQQLQNNPYSPSDDIWSLGCIFIELFLGKPFFSSIKSP